MVHLLAMFGMPAPIEWIVIAAFGLLIFGKRLPEVGRNLGKGIVEFKKGLKGVTDEIEQADQHQPTTPSQRVLPEQTVQAQAVIPTTVQPQYKFDPYTGKPITTENTASASAEPTEHSQPVSRS